MLLDDVLRVELRAELHFCWLEHELLLLEIKPLEVEDLTAALSAVRVQVMSHRVLLLLLHGPFGVRLFPGGSDTGSPRRCAKSTPRVRQLLGLMMLLLALLLLMLNHPQGVDCGGDRVVVLPGVIKKRGSGR
jgi:hypothetical protein